MKEGSLTLVCRPVERFALNLSQEKCRRKDLGQIVRNKRAMRNAAKEAYITKYVEITSRIAAEFPRDTTMHDLFFDDARTKSALAEADEDENVESSDDENTGDNKPG